MRIREQVLTPAAPEQAWALIRDLARHHEWNPKITATEVSGSGEPGVGTRYRITYTMSGRANEYEAEVTEWSPPHAFAARLEERVKGDGRNAARYMLERYDVTPVGARTRVVHDVRVVHSGIPLPLRILIWVIMHLGRPTEPTVMQTFAALAEKESAAPTAPAYTPIG